MPAILVVPPSNTFQNCTVNTVCCDTVELHDITLQAKSQCSVAGWCIVGATYSPPSIIYSSNRVKTVVLWSEYGTGQIQLQINFLTSKTRIGLFSAYLGRLHPGFFASVNLQGWASSENWTFQWLIKFQFSRFLKLQGVGTLGLLYLRCRFTTPYKGSLKATFSIGPNFSLKLGLTSISICSQGVHFQS